MRGLKLNNRRFDLECEESHLLQMRGLKQGAAYAKTLAETSHLLQMRGLKLLMIFGMSMLTSRIFYRCVD